MRLQSRPLLNLFSDKASLILRALLRDPDRKWRISDFAKQGLSAGQIVNVMNLLSERGFVYRNQSWRDKYVQLTQPKRLLDEWIHNYNFKWNWQTFYKTEKPDFINHLVEFLKKRNIPYALTMMSASRLVAPYVIDEVEHVYIGVDRKLVEVTLREIETHFGLDYPQSNGNVCVALPFYKSSIFRDARLVKGKPVVSDLQLYLDLMNHPVTGADQAAWLEKRLKEQGKGIIGGESDDRS